MFILSNLLYQLKCQFILQWHYIDYLFIKLDWNQKTAHINSGKVVVLINEQLILHVLGECNTFFFATQSYFHTEVKPYHFMTCAFISWPVCLFMKYLSRNLGKKLWNTLVIWRNFKHNQNHRTMIWPRNTLKQNLFWLKSFKWWGICYILWHLFQLADQWVVTVNNCSICYSLNALPKNKYNTHNVTKNKVQIILQHSEHGIWLFHLRRHYLALEK